MNIFLNDDAGIVGGKLAVHLLVQAHESVILTNKPESAIKSTVRGDNQ